MSERSALKVVVVDRDGTLNELRDDHVKTPEEWQAIPGALEAVARLHQAGWQVVVATNQSGLGRGLFDMSTLNAIHQKMNAQLAVAGGRVDAIFFCPHAPEDGCDCRKPLPGLFEDIAERLGVELCDVHAVGDSPRDVQAARNAGCKNHLVLTGRSAGLDDAGLARLREQVGELTVHADLAAFADSLIVAERRKTQEARRPGSAST
jgi:D-glycero-D-manno-heptose 1,7-bisphosphate phosphatase